MNIEKKPKSLGQREIYNDIERITSQISDIADELEVLMGKLQDLKNDVKDTVIDIKNTEELYEDWGDSLQERIDELES